MIALRKEKRENKTKPNREKMARSMLVLRCVQTQYFLQHRDLCLSLSLTFSFPIVNWVGIIRVTMNIAFSFLSPD